MLESEGLNNDGVCVLSNREHMFRSRFIGPYSGSRVMLIYNVVMGSLFMSLIIWLNVFAFIGFRKLLKDGKYNVTYKKQE
jgi:hypothetical protein